MARIMLVQPWNYHDEGVKEHDLTREWRNGPYSLLLLATQLRNHHHQVKIVDMVRDLVALEGDAQACLASLSAAIQTFRPDIIGFSFFSVHFFEVMQGVRVARRTCKELGIDPMFIAGGIHASTEPHETINQLGFDYSFVGEADVGLLQLADGERPETVLGVVGPDTAVHGKGEEVRPLDSLPFPDWSLCDYQFYTHPSYAKTKFAASRTLDMMMGRGCVYHCAFCAYSALSTVRFYTADYLANQVDYMEREFKLDSVYFTDSTIGNNRKLIVEFCELMIQRGLSERIAWYANMRPNQVTEDLLRLMWRAGCRFLFYGFESGSQRVLDLMAKGVKLEDNYRAAELHNRLRFPYHASMLLGYPGEREADIQASLRFLERTEPPIIGINWYVPLPGSPDYDRLKAEGSINTDDPWEWRRVGEVNSTRVYADVPEQRFRELYAQAERLAYVDMRRTAAIAWGCVGPPRDGTNANAIRRDQSSSIFGRIAQKLHRYMPILGNR